MQRKEVITILEFRPLDDHDLPMVENWLHKPHVKKWYEIPSLGITIDDWVQEIREYKGKFQWITYLIVILDNHPIGLCLYYKCADSKDENFGALPRNGSYGIDYFIGEESQLGKGLGKKMVSLLVTTIFSISTAYRLNADIDPHNTASKNTLLTCGFTSLLHSSTRYVISRNK